VFGHNYSPLLSPKQKTAMKAVWGNPFVISTSWLLALAPCELQVAGWSSGQIPRTTLHELFSGHHSIVGCGKASRILATNCDTCNACETL